MKPVQLFMTERKKKEEKIRKQQSGFYSLNERERQKEIHRIKKPSPVNVQTKQYEKERNKSKLKTNQKILFFWREDVIITQVNEVNSCSGEALVICWPG